MARQDLFPLVPPVLFVIRIEIRLCGTQPSAWKQLAGISGRQQQDFGPISSGVRNIDALQESG